MTIVVQINGKLRDRIEMNPEATEDEIRSEALGASKIQEYLEGIEPAKVIVVPGKLVNIVLT